MEALPSFERRRILLDAEEQAPFVPADVDYVADCTDSFNCRVALVATRFERGVDVASSKGAGNKLDPTRIRIADGEGGGAAVDRDRLIGRCHDRHAKKKPAEPAF